jgi:DNA-binding winged helix-turn-helix (wHTH) protein
MSGDHVRFGRFRLDLGRRELSRDGVPMHLSARALDILCILVSAKGDVVTKDELMARVWPGLVVEEGNIHVHISAMRKALDDGKGGQSYVMTVPGRAYRFLGSDRFEPRTSQGSLRACAWRGCQSDEFSPLT